MRLQIFYGRTARESWHYLITFSLSIQSEATLLRRLMRGRKRRTAVRPSPVSELSPFKTITVHPCLLRPLSSDEDTEVKIIHCFICWDKLFEMLKFWEQTGIQWGKNQTLISIFLTCGLLCYLKKGRTNFCINLSKHFLKAYYLALMSSVELNVLSWQGWASRRRMPKTKKKALWSCISFVMVYLSGMETKVQIRYPVLKPIFFPKWFLSAMSLPLALLRI